MVSRVRSFVLQGIEAVPCDIEVDVNPTGLPRTTVVGLPDAAVRESTERVRTAIRSSGYRYPPGRVTVNLAPATVRKEGPVYDLPIAVAMLCQSGTIDTVEARQRGLDTLFMGGELALDGDVRPVRGVVSLAMLARIRGAAGVVVPADNAVETAAVEGIPVHAASTLSSVVTFLNGGGTLPTPPPTDVEAVLRSPPVLDFRAVRGQEAAKRALALAAAGGHNVLLFGPPGTGKTMMARALPSILPALSHHQALEVTRIQSSVGALPRGTALVAERPVRCPHHTASAASIIGGGSMPRPGEVTLAHHGVLFLDELPEFGRRVLETLRQPLEDHEVTIARTAGTARFPARFLLVAAMNPSPGGSGPLDEAYLSRISSPLLDRIDMHVEVPAVPFAQLRRRAAGTNTEELRALVVEAIARRTNRQGALGNAELTGDLLDEHAALPEDAMSLLDRAMTTLGLSARAFDRIRRVARTIADIDGVDDVGAVQIAEAIQYRLLDRVQGGAPVGA